MKLRTMASVAVALVCMTGCNNLNTTVYVTSTALNSEQVEALQIPAHSPASAPVASRPSASAVKPLGREPKKRNEAVAVCPIFHLPVLPKEPELPIREIAAIGPGHPEQVEAIERKHIEELRAYMTRVRQLMTEARVRYLSECAAYLKR